ncbi:MAG: YrzE family protein [Candidatus Rhabdochlamydia oedothoracis]|nr:YrzE family protein [Candidatus Rhabdochlamydia oedothoracis]
MEYKAMAIPKDFFIQNPALLLKKDEMQVFDALGDLKLFANALSSKEEIPPSKIEKVAQIVGYTTFTGYLCTSLAKEITSSAILSRANSVLNDINTLISGALYGLAAVQNGYQLAQDQNLNELLKQEDALALQGLIQNVPISSHLNQLKTSWSALANQESKKQHFKQKIEKLALEGLKNTQIQPSDLDELLQILQAQDSSNEVHQLLGLTDKADKDYWKFTPLEALGLLMDRHKVKARRLVQLKEASSLPVAQAVDKAYRRGLLERVNSADELVQKSAKTEMKKLMGRVRVESTKTKKIHTALFTINLLGAILSVVGVLTLPFGVGIAIYALSFLITTASIGSKVYLAKKNLSDTPCGKCDKAKVIIIAILFGISLIALTGITLGFGLSFIQLGVSLGVGALGMGFLGYYYHLLTQKDALWKQAHPSLEVFQTFLSQKEQWDQEVHDLFKKMPKDVRIELRQQYKQKNLPSKLSLKNKISALKKTSKYFWNQWLISGLEKDRALALEIQSVYEEAKNIPYLIKKLEKGSEQQKESLESSLETHLNQVLANPQVKEQWDQDLKYVFYRKCNLNNLRKDLKLISEVSALAAQKILTKPLSSTKITVNL